MTVRELIEELEEFASIYGDDIKVAINRNGREYPVYVNATGAFPANTDTPRYSSGYFKYLDDSSDEDIPTRSEFNDWVNNGDTDYATYEDFLEDNGFIPNLCILND